LARANVFGDQAFFENIEPVGYVAVSGRNEDGPGQATTAEMATEIFRCVLAAAIAALDCQSHTPFFGESIPVL